MTTFTDQVTKAMGQAFEQAWRELCRVEPHLTSPVVAEANKQRLAALILDFAEDGVSEIKQLKTLGVECFLDSVRPKLRRPAPQYTGL